MGAQVRDCSGNQPLRQQLLQDGLQMMAFTTQDRETFRQYLAVRFQPPAWLQQVRFRQPLPPSLLARGRHVPLRLANSLSQPARGTRDIYLEGCVIRLVLDSWVVIDILTPVSDRSGDLARRARETRGYCRTDPRR